MKLKLRNLEEIDNNMCLNLDRSTKKWNQDRTHKNQIWACIWIKKVADL